MSNSDLSFLYNLYKYFFGPEFGTDLLMWLIGVIILLVFIQQNKYIPWKPLTWIANAIGRAINNDMYIQISSISDTLSKNTQKLETLRNDMQQMNVDTLAREQKMQAEDARRRIIKFTEELTRGEKHSKEAFDDALEDCDKYTKYYDAHPEIKNGVARHAVKYINDCYDAFLANNDFLDEKEKRA